eukprot:TRINITY_DN2173_c0_g2_i6.p1 TRINITY_DN2173_c0_g2~~TRINITY_DN2173_c0_g2_i6.p1  ORF type:complete len:115 (-),score=4.62 TRINITY_DN2173_c0_g2_i6:62-406(-)
MRDSPGPQVMMDLLRSWAVLGPICFNFITTTTATTGILLCILVGCNGTTLGLDHPCGVEGTILRTDEVGGMCMMSVWGVCNVQTEKLGHYHFYLRFVFNFLKFGRANAGQCPAS